MSDDQTPAPVVHLPVRLSLLERAVLVEIAPDSPFGVSSIIPLPVELSRVENPILSHRWLHD